MDKIYERGLLFDFYGELLTSHQQKIYSEAVFNDMSLSELSEEEGISRQGIHDLIRRCDKILQEYEDKLHLIERFKSMKKTVHSMEELVDTMDDASSDKIKMKEMLHSLLEEL